jgi:hypothetical protein
MPPPPVLHPRGLGVYLARIVRAWDAQAAARHAQRARAARLRWVVLCAEAEDGWIAPLDVLARAAEVYRELASCSVWIYGLHSPRAVEQPERAADRLGAALRAVEGSGVVLDVERAYKGRAAAVRLLVEGTIDQLTERHGLGVTSYPLARAHPTLPWLELSGVGWGGPQTYETAEDRRLARRAIAEWRTRHDVVIPHLPSYDVGERDDGTQAAQLDRHLHDVCRDDDGAIDVPGAALWSEASLDTHERRVLATWAELAGW